MRQSKLFARARSLPKKNNCDEADWIEDVEEVEDIAETEDFEDTDSNIGSNKAQQENPQAEQILRVVRDLMPINPQLKAEVLKYSLAKVVAVVTRRSTGQPGIGMARQSRSRPVTLP